jgi:hypothetical protein
MQTGGLTRNMERSWLEAAVSNGSLALSVCSIEQLWYEIRLYHPNEASGFCQDHKAHRHVQGERHNQAHLSSRYGNSGQSTPETDGSGVKGDSREYNGDSEPKNEHSPGIDRGFLSRRYIEHSLPPDHA